MNWDAILLAISAGALGGIVVKILDISILAPLQERIERRRWLREKRLEAFSELAKHLLALGLTTEAFNNIWQLLSISGKAQLLIEDDELVLKLRRVIWAIWTYQQHHEDRGLGELAEFMQLQLDVVRLIDDLRKEIVGPRAWWDWPEEFDEPKREFDDEKLIGWLRDAHEATKRGKLPPPLPKFEH